MDDPPTVIDLKLAFLRSQIQALSQPVTLPPNYQPASEENAVRLTSIDAALAKLNETIKNHSKLSYSGQARRHVAEQIDRLYWQAGERDVDTGEGLERGADLSLEKNIVRLQDSWDGEEGDEETRARYQDSAAAVKELDERRKQMKEKVAVYKMFKEMLQPLDDAMNTVQVNLVGRDGEMEKELEKMRLLTARVRGRVEQLRKNMEEGEDIDDDLQDEGKKLEALF